MMTEKMQKRTVGEGLNEDSMSTNEDQWRGSE